MTTLGRRLLRMFVHMRRHPAGLLLAAQLLSVVLYPVIDGTGASHALFGAFGIMVLALVLWVVNRNPTVNWLAWMLAIPAVGLSLWADLGSRPDLVVYAHMLESAIYFYAAVGLIAYMLSDQSVTRDELLAIGATFTLLAWSWAFAYSVCQTWYPGSFTAAVAPNEPRTWMELLFMSFSVLSGVGLSDIVPVTPPARALVMLEMFAGVMYIAIVVSRLIGLLAQRVR
jgi:Ion channel